MHFQCTLNGDTTGIHRDIYVCVMKFSCCINCCTFMCPRVCQHRNFNLLCAIENATTRRAHPAKSNTTATPRYKHVMLLIPTGFQHFMNFETCPCSGTSLRDDGWGANAVQPWNAGRTLTPVPPSCSRLPLCAICTFLLPFASLGHCPTMLHCPIASLAFIATPRPLPNASSFLLRTIGSSAPWPRCSHESPCTPYNRATLHAMHACALAPHAAALGPLPTYVP